MPKRTSRTLLPYLLTILVLVALSQVSDHSSAQTNQPPVAMPDTYNVHGSVVTPANANVLANDSDPDGDQLTVNYQTVTTVPGVGNFVVYWTGSVGATGGGVPGTAVIPYTITDNHGGQASSTVTFNVQNSAPTANFDIIRVVGEDYFAEPGESVLANDSDADGDPIHTSYQTLANLPNNAGLYGIDQNGFVAIYRNPAFAGTVVVFYEVIDSLGARSYGAIVIVMEPMDGANKAGRFCPSEGEPVNVTNGNMWIDQPSDYTLPGVGENIEIKRFYNSVIQENGMFGFGWSTQYDESLWAYGDKMMRLSLPDGLAVYFARMNTTEAYTSVKSDVQGQIVQNPDTTFTLTFKDGRVHDFGPDGRLLRQKDQSGNQTSLGYDTNGALVSVTDALGRILTLTPNANGTINSISDPVGTVATYDYFPGTTRLQTVTYADGSKYKFEYDSTSATGKVLVKTVKDALDNILETHLYDSLGRALTSEKHGAQEKYEFDYSNWTGANPYTVVKHKQNASDPSIETKYFFNNTRGPNLITKIAGSCGGCGGSGSEVTEYFYDSQLNRIRMIDALGRETLYVYDSDRNLIQQTDTFGLQKWTYNSRGQVLTYRDRIDSLSTEPVTFTNVLTYDASGNLKTLTDALGHTTTIEYPSANNKGLPDSVTDARNHTTKFKWFAASLLLEEVEDPYAKKTGFTYDARGRIKTVTNALNHITQYNYFDDTQRKVEKIYPNLDKIIYKYDIRRLPESVTDERGKVTVYEYDTAYRLKKITDPLSHIKEFGYDLMSNRTSFKDALGNITDLSYDDFDRLEEIEYPAAASGATRLKERYEYDKLGRIKKIFDTADRLTEYAYDDINRIRTVTNAEQETTTAKYDRRFRAVEAKDALNQVYQFAYDALGRLLSQTRSGGTLAFEYDAVGNIKKRTDYAGRVTNYTFDRLNRLEKIAYGNPVPTGYPPNLQSVYGYDDISRLISATNEAGTVSFGYDNRGRTTSTTDVFGQTLNYEYELSPGVSQKRLMLNGALYATYNYDDAYRLTNIVNASDSSTIAYGYDNADRRTSRTLPNGVTSTYEYDNMSRLKRLKDVNAPQTLFDRQYGYNTASQISGITEPGRSRAFVYDNIDRLTSVTDAAYGNESYGYDEVGNRLSSHLSNAYNYQPFNKLSTTQTGNYRYDENGNMVSKAEGSKFWRYTWDYENRLSVAADRKQSVRYKYDALGRRVERNVGFSLDRTKFTYDGDDVLVDDNAGTQTKYQNGPGIDNKLSVRTGTTTNYFLADHLGSTNGLTDSTGAISSQASYDSFGNQSGTLATRYGFTGRERDDTTGLMHYRARFYDPKLGRFISEDPIGFGGGDINLYGYVWNNPQTYRDPSGNGFFVPILLGAWAVFEVAATAYDTYDFGRTITDPCPNLTDVGFSGGGLMIGAIAPGGGHGNLLKALRRPYVRKGTREVAEQSAKRGPDGDFLDVNTLEPIPDGKYDLGHKYGKEYWRLREKATADGLTQQEFNDLLNDPDLYQIELPRNNRRRIFEMPK